MRFGCWLLLAVFSSALPLSGQAVCASCHASIAASYARTGMARAFSRANAASVPMMPKPFYHEASETYFSIVRRGPLFLHRRWQEGADGDDESGGVA